MRIAVMQPYIFPYIGYFQMIKAVDKFVFYDDVNFIKRGWINRNKILINGKDNIFSIPLVKASQNISINQTYIKPETFKSWREKFLQTLTFNYKKAPYFKEVNTIIKQVLHTECDTISELAIESVISVSKYLALEKEFIIASKRYNNISLERQDRLIDISTKENAAQYINALGGQELYTKESFQEKGIILHFIKTSPITYKQFNDEFVPWLSIIDVLMFNSVDQVNEMLDKYELI